MLVDIPVAEWLKLTFVYLVSVIVGLSLFIVVFCRAVRRSLWSYSGLFMFGLSSRLALKVSEPNLKSTPGYIYLISGAKSYKIGLAKDPQTRVKELQTSSPAELKLVHAIETNDMRIAEGFLHSGFADCRMHGEWFRLSDEQVKWLRSIHKIDIELPPVVVEVTKDFNNFSVRTANTKAARPVRQPVIYAPPSVSAASTNGVDKSVVE